MNRQLFSLAITAVITFCLSACIDKKKEFRDQLSKECFDSGEKQFADKKVKSYFKEYCDCSSEKISEQMSKQEFTRLKDSSDEAELQSEIMPIVQPCLDELRKKMNVQQ